MAVAYPDTIGVFLGCCLLIRLGWFLVCLPFRIIISLANTTPTDVVRGAAEGVVGYEVLKSLKNHKGNAR